MRCSSFETLLDRFAEGTLPAPQMQRVRAHVERCDSCAALLTELRVVDALLATTSPAALAPNFTFALMAEVRSMRAPQLRSRSVWSGLAFYLVATWVVICGSIAVFGARLSTIGTATEAARTSLAHGAGAIAGAAHALGPATPAVIGVGVGVLAMDVILIGLIALFYYTVRPRLSARLARSEAS
ncbi:MAG: zf-HC2 domain-containing protein [Candidatus Baltobacteraceae bacterium]